MNTEYTIVPTPGDTVGVQQSISNRLKIRLDHAMKINPSIASKKCVYVKITGDGTVVCRSSHLVIIAFGLVEEENPMAITLLL